jgi:hypothetical protein
VDSNRLRPSGPDKRQALLDDYVSRVVAKAPALTTEQIDRVAVLLRGGAA